MFDGSFRDSVDKRTNVLAKHIAKLGVTGDHLTVVGLVGAVASAVVIGSGHLLWGALVVIASAVPDLLDGPVAKSTNMHSVRGAFFDSVADRITDNLILGGIAWYLATSMGARWALLAMFALGVSNLVSYERAKAESLGFDAKGGLMERAERLLFLIIGLAIPGALVPVLLAMCLLTTYTVLFRFAKVWRQASQVRREQLQERGVHLPDPWRPYGPLTLENLHARWSAMSGPARRAPSAVVGREPTEGETRAAQRHQYRRRRRAR